MPQTFGVVDLFAGPGGLGEGFTSVLERKHSPFKIGISVEKELSAHRTLTLRSFLRNYRKRYGKLPQEFVDFHAGQIPEPDWATVQAQSWREATEEALCLELGTESAAKTIESAARRLRRMCDDTILIGGPPCQAYSLVGRARAKGNVDYIPEKDERHYLFREYIRVLEKLRPAAFVLENVKGMLSSTIDSQRVFELLMEDLSSVGKKRGSPYGIHAIHLQDGEAYLAEASQPSDFIVRAEAFGVPQRRHRVIIVGIRSDVESGLARAKIAVPKRTRSVLEAIGDLPVLRSGVDKGKDSPEHWLDTATQAAEHLAKLHCTKDTAGLRNAFEELAGQLRDQSPLSRSSSIARRGYGKSNDELKRWLESPGLRVIAQHETRSHMSSDLARYMFAAVFGRVHGWSPKSDEFPRDISPDHHNWRTGIFSDRFRVQLGSEPSTTITSHISKDGHYFIHPDPLQCRSLTVREAARLQTFPDDYLFLGNRTQQYVQVGNAVPPFLARQIAELVHRVLTKA